MACWIGLRVSLLRRPIEWNCGRIAYLRSCAMWDLSWRTYGSRIAVSQVRVTGLSR